MERLDAAPEDDMERFAFALWNAGRKDEAVEFLERQITRRRADAAKPAPIVIDVVPTRAAAMPEAGPLRAPEPKVESDPEHVPLPPSVPPLWTLGRPLIAGAALILAVAVLWGGGDRITALADWLSGGDAAPETVLATATLKEDSASPAADAAAPEQTASIKSPPADNPADDDADTEPPAALAAGDEADAAPELANAVAAPAATEQPTTDDASISAAALGPHEDEVQPGSLSRLVASSRGAALSPHPVVETASVSEDLQPGGDALSEPEMELAGAEPATSLPPEEASDGPVTLQELAATVAAAPRLPRPRPAPPPDVYRLAEPASGPDPLVIQEPDIVAEEIPAPLRTNPDGEQVFTVIGRVEGPGLGWRRAEVQRYYSARRRFAEERAAQRRYQFAPWGYPPQPAWGYPPRPYAPPAPWVYDNRWRY